MTLLRHMRRCGAYVTADELTLAELTRLHERQRLAAAAHERATVLLAATAIAATAVLIWLPALCSALHLVGLGR